MVHDPRTGLNTPLLLLCGAECIITGPESHATHSTYGLKIARGAGSSVVKVKKSACAPCTFD